MSKLPEYNVSIPSTLLHDNRLPAGARILYGELLALQEGNTVTISNSTVSEWYDVTTNTVSRWISELKECGYIDVAIINYNSRVIRIKGVK